MKYLFKKNKHLQPQIEILNQVQLLNIFYKYSQNLIPIINLCFAQHFKIFLYLFIIIITNFYFNDGENLNLNFILLKSYFY